MTNHFAPLASRLRPEHIDDYIGQAHLLAPGKPLRMALEKGLLHSMILWGPPGVGKTTLAQLLAKNANAHLEKISAVMSGVKEIREVIARAQEKRKEDIATILFVDEVHRFNKSQQDAFLPFVENGLLTLIGATTENPSFELNNALLSRARVYVLKPLEEIDLLKLLARALSDHEKGFVKLNVSFSHDLQEKLVAACDGDARQLLNLLEILMGLATEKDGSVLIEETHLKEVLSQSMRRFDKGGEYFHDLISALHKAVRGSDPQASLYWLARMIDGGCDPLYVARRVVRMASEDIGNADPRALEIALNAWETQERLGSPEGELAIAQAVVYMAIAAKSNAVYTAWQAACEDVKKYGSLEVPLHLRNAPTKLMKELGYAKQYRYAHDEPYAYAAGENYFPAELKERIYYEPTDRGLEKKIQEKLVFLEGLDKKSI